MKGIGFNIRNLQNFSDKPHKNTGTKVTSDHNIEFNKILSNRLEPEQSETLTTQKKKENNFSEIAAPRLSEINVPSHVSLMNDTPADISAKIDYTLDLLEKYSSMLSDPLKPLKSIDPVLQDINTSAKTIFDELQTGLNTDNTGHNHGLVKIINQILSIVNVEQFKMQRGDYTDR